MYYTSFFIVTLVYEVHIRSVTNRNAHQTSVVSLQVSTSYLQIYSFCFYCCFKINMINFVVFLLTSILNIFYRNLMSLRSVPEHFFAPKLLKTFSLKRPHQVLWHCECAVLYLIPLMFLCRIRHHLEGAQHIPRERTAWTRHACSRKMPPSVQLRLHPPAVLLPPNPKNLAL